MPEIQLPPAWGPAFDERDLDALLDGKTANLPETLIPLAGTLASLHVRPVPAELAGEAAARAAFRHFAPEARAWAGSAEHGTVPVHTLVLSRPQRDRPRRHTPRHRRRASGGTWRRPATIVGVAAALVIVAGVAVAGLRPSAIRHQSDTSALPAASATRTGQPSPSPSSGVLGTATQEPRPAAPTTPGALCREFYGFFDNQEPSSGWTAEDAVWGKLEHLAGGPWKVLSYCLRYVDFDTWASHGTGLSSPHGNFWGSGNEGNSGNGSGGRGSNGTKDDSGSGQHSGSGQPGSGQPGIGQPGSGQPGFGQHGYPHDSVSRLSAGQGAGQP